MAERTRVILSGEVKLDMIQHGFVRVAAGVPCGRVADCTHNAAAHPGTDEDGPKSRSRRGAGVAGIVA